jgi:hypothetical protein
MKSDERRVLELTAVLEELLECFEDVGDAWTVESYGGGIMEVSDDVGEIIERAQAILYNEGDSEIWNLDEDEDDCS